MCRVRPSMEHLEKKQAAEEEWPGPRTCQSMSLPIISQREGLKSISDIIIEELKEYEC